MTILLPALPYAYNALEPLIDARTMEIHHTKHHQAYITNLNAAIAGTAVESQSVEWLITHLTELPEAIRGAVQNNGGGDYNHRLFWTILSPPSDEPRGPSGELLDAINAQFNSVDAFKGAFETAAKTRFGSGWAWLSLTQSGELLVSSTPNQDSPLMAGHSPLLGLDVWEHAYYLTYQNRRPDYVSAFWGLVNWDQVTRRYTEARSRVVA